MEEFYRVVWKQVIFSPIGVLWRTIANTDVVHRSQVLLSVKEVAWIGLLQQGQKPDVRLECRIWSWETENGAFFKPDGQTTCLGWTTQPLMFFPCHSCDFCKSLWKHQRWEAILNIHRYSVCINTTWWYLTCELVSRGNFKAHCV